MIRDLKNNLNFALNVTKKLPLDGVDSQLFPHKRRVNRRERNLIGIWRIGAPVEGQERMFQRLERLVQHGGSDAVQPRTPVARPRSWKFQLFILQLCQWRGWLPVNAEPDNCSAYRPYAHFCGEFCPSGRASGHRGSSVANSLPNPLKYFF